MGNRRTWGAGAASREPRELSPWAGAIQGGLCTAPAGPPRPLQPCTEVHLQVDAVSSQAAWLTQPLCYIECVRTPSTALPVGAAGQASLSPLRPWGGISGAWSKWVVGVAVHTEASGGAALPLPASGGPALLAVAPPSCKLVSLYLSPSSMDTGGWMTVPTPGRLHLSSCICRGSGPTST